MEKTATTKHRILIVDDHPIFREGLVQMIDREPDMQVVGEAPNADAALKALERNRVDLCLVDISLDGANGIDLIKRIRDEQNEVPILVLSMHDESLYAERALKAGAQGFIMKQEPARKVRQAMRKVLSGELYLSDNMSVTVISKFVGGGHHVESPIDRLSDRELEVFRLIGKGHGTRQIAEELKLSIPTINSFRARIKDKLNLNNAAELGLHAIQWVQNVNSRQ